MILRHVYSPSPWCGPSRRPAPCHGMNLGSLERTPSCQRGVRMRLGSTARLPAALSSLRLRLTPLVLDTSGLSRPRSRPHPLRRQAICPSARCPSRRSTLGGETTAPPFSTSPLSFRLLPCGDGSDTPFSAAVLAGTAGWRQLRRPGGTALLCFPATWDPPGFRCLPKRLAIICPGRTANLLGSPRKSGAWP